MKAQRILIIGSSCSGKTTLGQKLQKSIAYKCIDLDNLHWLPDWKERPDEEFLDLIHSEIMSHQQWIVSGSYFSITKDNVWQEADTIIWLNYSLSLVLYRYVSRTYRRITTKEKCCNGNIQTLRRAISIEDNLLQYILMGYYSKIKRFKACQEGQFKDKNWIVLKRPSEEKKLYEKLN